VCACLEVAIAIGFAIDNFAMIEQSWPAFLL